VQALRAQWNHERHTVETRRTELLAAQQQLALEREGRAEAQRHAAAEAAGRAACEGVFAKWKIPHPPTADAPVRRELQK
jgi:hypothetical protein